MKFARVFLMILPVIFGVSCVSRPAVAPPRTVISQPPAQLPIEEPPEPFDRALWNVKMNTPLFKKTFEAGAAIVSGPGINGAENIFVKGEALIDGKEYKVTYDLTGANPNGGNVFSIPFFMENLTDGTACFDEMSWSPVEDEAGILLSFDDDYWYSWSRFFYMFDRFGAKVTFFVQGAPGPDAKEGLMEFCFDVLNRGHDLGFHSISHPDLRKVSLETFNLETLETAEAFIKAGIPLSAFAYPFGFSEPWMREALVPFFSFTRGYGTNIRFYNSETLSSRYLVSKAIDNIIYPDEDKFKSEIFRILFAAKFTGYHIVPFTTHDISDTAQWGIKPERLEFLLKTARDLKMKFYLYSGAAL